MRLNLLIEIKFKIERVRAYHVIFHIHDCYCCIKMTKVWKFKSKFVKTFFFKSRQQSDYVLKAFKLAVSNRNCPDDPVLNPILIWFVSIARYETIESDQHSSEYNPTGIRQWTDTDGKYLLKNSGIIAMIRFCWNAI